MCYAQLVFLDEPSAGLDPLSRRHLWDLVDKAKRQRAIVLTTHSMEEADILGDRCARRGCGRGGSGLKVARGDGECVGVWVQGWEAGWKEIWWETGKR